MKMYQIRIKLCQLRGILVYPMKEKLELKKGNANNFRGWHSNITLKLSTVFRKIQK